MLLTNHATVLVERAGTILHVPISEDFDGADAFDASPHERVVHAGGAVSVQTPRGALSAIPGGTTAFHRADIAGWETFLPIGGKELDALRSALSARYLFAGSDRVLQQPQAIALDGSPDFTLGTRRYNLFGNIGQFSDAGSSFVNLFFDGWKVDLHRIFDPVIYFCAFGNDTQIRLLEKAIEACVTYGRYEGRFCVLSDRPDLVRGALAGVGNEIIVLQDGASNLHEYWQARYGIHRHEMLNRYGPFLYLDTDVVVDTDINDTLLDIFRCERVSVYSEPRTAEARDSFGRVLMRNDHLSPGAFMGINSGIFGFPSMRTARPFLKSVVDTMDRYKRHVAECETFNFFDQSVANYVLRKFDLASFDALRGKVRTFWGGYFEDGDRPSGFCHFTHKPKLPDLERYVDLLATYHDRLGREIMFDDRHPLWRQEAT